MTALTRTAEHAAKDAIADGLASALGNGWTHERHAEPSYWQRTLVRADGGRLFLDLSVNGKITITPGKAWRKDDHKRYNAPESRKITCSLSRGFAAVAADVTRKTLPTLDAIIAFHAAQDATDATDKSAAAMTVATLSSALPLLRFAEPDGISGTDARFYSDGLYGDVETNHDGSRVDLKLRGLSVVHAEAILAIVARCL